jgi:hypothetical protein
MSRNTLDYPYAHRLLGRINSLTISGKGIHNYFMYEGYDFWQAYQTDIFIELKRFTKDERGTIHSLERTGRIPVLFSLMSFSVYIAVCIVSIFKRSRVLVYSVDKRPQGEYRCDFRLRELYEALSTTDTKYRELLYTASLRTLVRNVLIRKRLAVYTNAADFLTWILSSVWNKKRRLIPDFEGQDFTNEEHIFIEALLRKLDREFRCVPLRVFLYKIFFRMNHVHTIYCIDDVWHYFEILCAAKSTRIQTIAIQHGHFTKYHVGMFPYLAKEHGVFLVPDSLYVWTGYWRDELVRLNSIMKSSAIVVAGLRSVVVPHAVHSSRPLGVLIPYETDAPKDRMKPFLDVLRHQSDIQIFFKPRSDLNLDMQLAQYGFHRDDEHFRVCESLESCIDEIHVAVGTYTTLFYDLVLMHIPVILLPTVLDYGEGMVHNGLAVPVNEPAELYAAICKESERDTEYRNLRAQKLKGNEPGSLLQTLTHDLLVRKNDNR